MLLKAQIHDALESEASVFWIECLLSQEQGLRTLN